MITGHKSCLRWWRGAGIREKGDSTKITFFSTVSSLTLPSVSVFFYFYFYFFFIVFYSYVLESGLSFVIFAQHSCVLTWGLFCVTAV